MTKEYYQHKIKAIQDKYPKSWCSPPSIGIIQHVNDIGAIEREEVVNEHSLNYYIDEYEKNAKQSHESSLQLEQFRLYNKDQC